MNFYKFNLLLTSVLVIVIYFTIPFYSDWLKSKALSPNNNIFDQMQRLDTNYRKEYRLGSTYVLDMDIKRVLSGHKDVVLLMPNNDFIKANDITGGVDMQEPATFYYYTGITAVWANSPDAQRANWVLYVSKKTGMRIMDIKSKGQRDSIIQFYGKYIK